MTEDISDEELARFLKITPEEGRLIFPGMLPARRAEYARMALVAKKLCGWSCGNEDNTD